MDTPDQPKSESANFLKLLTTLVILGSVWFGTTFFGTKNAPQNEKITIQNTVGSIQQDVAFAAALPSVQGVFLNPTADPTVPIRNWDIKEPILTAESIYAVEIDSNKILLEKDADKIRPIASLSKLLTALVAMDRLGLDDEIEVGKDAVDTFGETGGLVVGEKISVQSLLYVMLIESSNDAAVALADKLDGQFVDFMNQKTSELNLKNTHFSDPSGLNNENVSNAKDLEKIMEEFIKNPLLAGITKNYRAEIVSLDGKYKHKLTSTDKLLPKYPEIIAGKTGYIEESGNCMAIALKSPGNKGIIINVILASTDRLGDMDKLIQWEKEAFVW